MTDQAAHPVSTGPHVVLAVFCEKVLEEATGVLSLIRIVDRVTITPPANAPAAMPPTRLTVNLVIGFKADMARGRATLTLRPQKPSGVYLPELGFPIFFEGQERGANLIVNLDIDLDEEGLYWFDIVLDDRLVTRMPLRVLYQPMSVGAQGASSP